MSRLFGFLRLGTPVREAGLPAARPSANGAATRPPPVPVRDLIRTSWWSESRGGGIPADQFPDDLTAEGPEHRARYREMLRDPYVDSGFNQLVDEVAQQTLEAAPGSDLKRDRKVAEFHKYNIDHSDGGRRAVVEAILAGPMIDGYGVCFPSVRPRAEDRGEWAGKRCLEALRPKDSQFYTLEVDGYRRLVGVRPKVVPDGMREAPLIPASRLIVTRHRSIFDAPNGRSAFRVIDRAYCCLDALLALREQSRELFGRGPVVVAEDVESGSAAEVDALLPRVRSGGWARLPAGVKLHVYNLAVGPWEEYANACRELKQEIYTGLLGSYLTAMTGAPGEDRGDSRVQQSVTKGRVWYLTEVVLSVINSQLVPLFTDLNWAGKPPYPTLSLTGFDPAWNDAVAGLLERAKKNGVDTSEEQWREVTTARPPREGDPGDVVPGDRPAVPAGPFGGPGDGEEADEGPGQGGEGDARVQGRGAEERRERQESS